MEKMFDFSKCNVLVVDDAETNIDILVDALGNDYEISVAMDGKGALELVKESPPDLILLDIMMPGMDGYEVCRLLKEDPYTEDISVIFLTAIEDVLSKTKCFELGAVDYITKPFENLEVKARVRTHLSLALAKRELSNQNVILEERIRERTGELLLTRDATIVSMATLAEYRDPETGAHIVRTKNYVKLLAEQLCSIPKYSALLDETTIDMLHKSAPLHDIGKVGVPDNILLKKGKLTHGEYEEMKKHATYGRDAIKASERALAGTSSFLAFAREIAFSHHEKWDGSGYPRGFKGEEIPLSGRIMAIADVYDALVSKRCYKPPIPHAKAIRIILDGDGRTLPEHFDPDILSAFEANAESFKQIALDNADFL